MREILYKKTETRVFDLSSESKHEIPKKENKNEPEKIAQWLKEAKILNLAALCREAGLDRANFDKYVNIGKLPEKYVSAILPIITKYGYK